MEIDDQRVDGNFVSSKGEILAGNEEVKDLLQRCLLWSNIVLERSATPLYFFGIILAADF
jgi:hypothetical protein